MQVSDFIDVYLIKKLACTLQYLSYKRDNEQNNMREIFRMTRQSLKPLRVSPLRLQQGLFASLALMVTLIGGQQLQHWQQSQQSAPQFERAPMTQTHFRSVGSSSAEVTAPRMMAVEQDIALYDEPTQERWVF